MTSSLPLSGRQVVVTRPEQDGGPLSDYLKGLGAQVIYWPAIQFLPPIDDRPLKSALAKLADYDWIVFSSLRAVEAVVALVSWPIGGPKVAAVGEATSATLVEAGWPVDLEADPARGAALVAVMGEAGCEGDKVLFPASAMARKTIPQGLESHGAVVDRIIAYRTVPADLDRESCRRSIDSGQIAAVTFASPSAANGLKETLGDESFELLMSGAVKVAIGPTTAEALEALGHPADAVAARSHLAGLAEAVESALSSNDSLPRRP